MFTRYLSKIKKAKTKYFKKLKKIFNTKKLLKNIKKSWNIFKVINQVGENQSP